MNGFKVRIILSELMGDKFTSLVDLDESCKKDGLKPTLKRLVKLIEKFIDKNELTEKT